MSFLLTTYIYPLEKPVILSNVMGLTLDNPKTEAEIEIIRTNLKVSLDSPNEMYQHNYYARLPIEEIEELDGAMTIKDSLSEFFKNNRKDKYVKRFEKDSNDDDVLTKLSKMWIILRFDDEGETAKLQQDRLEAEEKGEGSYFVLLGDDNPIVENSKNAVKISYLYSLLFHTQGDEYFGKSFVFSENVDRLRNPHIDRSLNQLIMYFGFSAYSSRPDERLRWLINYRIAIQDLIEQASKIDELIRDEVTKEKILYIAELLQTASSGNVDPKITIVILVSILELLLTHNPDFNRFNIEDSINKQFQLKASLLIHQNDSTKQLSELKAKLKIIYNLRSNIAHGNFKILNKWIDQEFNKILKEEEDHFLLSKTIVLERVISDLYDYVRAVLTEYLKNKVLVEFIKEN